MDVGACARSRIVEEEVDQLTILTPTAHFASQHSHTHTPHANHMASMNLPPLPLFHHILALFLIILLHHREMRKDVNALGGCYLSESLAVSLPSLLSNVHQPLVLFVPLMHFIETGQQAHQQHEGNQAQQGEDGHRQRRELVH